MLALSLTPPFPPIGKSFPSLKTLRIWNRTRKNAEQLAAQFEGSFETVEVLDDLADACQRADLISSATMSTEPILKGEWISPGTHVDLIGAFRPDMREADDALISGCELFVDSRDTTLGHIGEVDIPISTGVIATRFHSGRPFMNYAGKRPGEARKLL